MTITMTSLTSVVWCDNTINYGYVIILAKRGHHCHHHNQGWKRGSSSMSISGAMSRGSMASSYRLTGCPRWSSRNFSKFHLFDSKNIYLINEKYFGRYFNFSWYLLFFPLSLTWYRPDDRVHSRAHEGTGTFSSLTGTASWGTCRWDSGSCHSPSNKVLKEGHQ